MSRIWPLAAAVAASAAAAALFAAGGDAKGTGGRTIVLYENQKASKSSFVDLPPASAGKQLGSPNFRVSIGDMVIFRTPLTTRPRGGGRAGGSLEGRATVLAGTTISNARLRIEATIVRKEGSIEVSGTYPPAHSRTLAVIGGTGAFARARGTLTNANLKNTIILRP